jgi:hypothetical protein
MGLLRASGDSALERESASPATVFNAGSCSGFSPVRIRISLLSRVVSHSFVFAPLLAWCELSAHVHIYSRLWLRSPPDRRRQSTLLLLHIYEGKLEIWPVYSELNPLWINNSSFNAPPLAAPVGDVGAWRLYWRRLRQGNASEVFADRDYRTPRTKHCG